MGKRDFLTVFDLTGAETAAIVERAAALKQRPVGEGQLEGKTVGLLFDKSSTRTRISFEVGVHQLGGKPLFLTSSEMQIGRGETIFDTAKVISRYLSAMVIRTFEHDIVEEFAHHAEIPVINALTDLHHPCQAIADMQTILENKGTCKVKLAYIGDGNNVAHSLLQAAARLGAEVVMACPEGHGPDAGILARAEEAASRPFPVIPDPMEAVRGADVIYTDTWVSMGQEGEEEERERLFSPYQVNETVLAGARPDAIVMHCLPAHRGQEITDAVMDGPQSVVFDQAENRLHSQKAILEFLLAP